MEPEDLTGRPHGVGPGRTVHGFGSVVAAAVRARFTTPAAFDHALATGNAEEAFLALLGGATVLAEEEFPDHPAEGLGLAILDRAEEILARALPDLPGRRREALGREYVVLAPSDGQRPPAVLYAATGSTGAPWADAELGK